MNPDLERLSTVKQRLLAAELRVGIARHTKLVVVTKTVPAERLLPIIEDGVKRGEPLILGESRVQEWEAKHALLSKYRPEWHFIGSLQKNKVKRVVGQVSLIHSVDSIELAQEISRASEIKGIAQEVLLQVNISHEVTKSGILPSKVVDVARDVMALSGIELRGLMCIGSPPGDVFRTRGEFEEMREIRNNLSRELAIELPELSMGMSEDFELAIECGATFVRVGSGIFGERD